MATAATIPVTKLPPGPMRPALFYDRHLYAIKHLPVNVDFCAAGETETTGISFDDYTRMQTYQHKLAPGRRSAVPEWALDDLKLRDLLLVYMERRSMGSCQRPITGDYKERFETAQHKIFLTREKRIASLDGLCKEYTRLNKLEGFEDRKKQLQIQIENLDTALCIDTNVAQLVCGIAAYYFRAGLTSAETAAALKIKPPHVRQIIWRLNKLWARMQNPPPARPPKQRKPRQRKIDIQQAAEMRRNGLTYSKIANHFGCQTDSVWLALKHAGLIEPRKKIDAQRAVEGRLQGFTYQQNASQLRKSPHAPALRNTHIRSRIDVQRAIALYQVGKSYRAISKELGCTDNLIDYVIRRAGVWKPRRKSKVKRSEPAGKYISLSDGTIQKHLAILERLAAENGGLIPARGWLNAHGYYQTYQVMLNYPARFAHLRREMKSTAAQSPK